MPDVRHLDGKRHDPFRKFNFRVLFLKPAGQSQDPIPVGEYFFQSVSGLRQSTEIVMYKEGDRRYDRKIPGKTTFDNIVLSRGLDQNGLLTSWARRIVEAGTSESEENIRMDVLVSLLARSKQGVVAAWMATEAWPAVFETEDLSGDSSDVLIQRLELAVESIVQTLPLSAVMPVLGDAYQI